jgi:thiol-disulfide isomerase/thioredoxin
MDGIKKHWKNILFFGFLIFMFTPPGMPIRSLLIKGVSFITSRVENLEIDEEDRISLQDWDWKLMDSSGNEVVLSKYKGKVILINNWATWCPPCIAEMPSLEKLYKQYGNKVVFLFVAHDEPQKVKSFLSKRSMNIPVYFALSSMPSQLSSNSIPTTFILNKKGEIVVRKTGAADWNSGQIHRILDKYLAK